jgi:signal peptide peptidase SppA
MPDNPSTSGLHSVPNLAAYLGEPWAVEPNTFRQGLALFRSMEWASHMAAWNERAAAADEAAPYNVDGGVAVLTLSGVMAKKDFSLMDSTSTVRLSRQLDIAGQDPNVKAVLLLVDSPGGMITGTSELADMVARVDKRKPVCAYVDGACCSAAMWVVSQCRRIDASAASKAGNMGVLMELVDETKADEMAGVARTYLATGDYKTAGFVPLTDQHREYYQALIDDTMGVFAADVARGRGMKLSDVNALADGRAFIARDAVKNGLIDGVSTFDAAMKRLRAYDPNRPKTAPKGARAEEKDTMEDNKTLRERVLAVFGLGGDDETPAVQTATQAAAPATTTTLAVNPLVAACQEHGITSAADITALKAASNLGFTALEDMRAEAKNFAVMAFTAEGAKVHEPAIAAADYAGAKAFRDSFKATAQNKLGVTETQGAARKTVDGETVVALDADPGQGADRTNTLLAMTESGRLALAKQNGK